jgi:inosine/xanthosine triphosphate pyrophosphatase family protein
MGRKEGRVVRETGTRQQHAFENHESDAHNADKIWKYVALSTGIVRRADWFCRIGAVETGKQRLSQTGMIAP